MSLQKLYYKSISCLKSNSSTIITCVGAVGVIATVVMAVKDTPKAMALLDEAAEEKGEELTKLEVVRIAGPVYIPTAVFGVSTLACIFWANALNKKQQASITGAYALLDSTFKRYRSKVKDLYGDNADNGIIESIAKDEYNEDEFSDFSDKDRLFFDFHSMRYFQSTIEEVQAAEYEFNKLFVHKGYVSVNEFYRLIGLDSIEGGDSVGWSIGAEYNYGYKWIKFNHDKTILSDGLECYVLSMDYEPHSDYLVF